MKRFGSIALALVFAAGCTGRDAARDAGDAVRGLVRVDLSYTARRRQQRGRRALRRAGALRPLSLVRHRQRADHPRLRRLRGRPARRLPGLRRHRRARLGARRRHRRADRRGRAARRRPPRAARPARHGDRAVSSRAITPSSSPSSAAWSTAATRPRRWRSASASPIRSPAKAATRSARSTRP